MKRTGKDIADTSLLRVEIAHRDNADDLDDDGDSVSSVSKGDNVSHCSEGIFMLLSNANN